MVWPYQSASDPWGSEHHQECKCRWTRLSDRYKLITATVHPSTSWGSGSRLHSYQKILLKQKNKERVSKKITGFCAHNAGLCTSTRSRPWVRSAGVARFSRMVDSVTGGKLAACWNLPSRFGMFNLVGDVVPTSFSVAYSQLLGIMKK